MPVQTLRPFGQLAIASISAVGAASAVIATSDDSDASYVIGTAINAYLKMSFTNMSPGLTATQRVKTCRLRLRAARGTGSTHCHNGYTALYSELGGSPVAKLSLSLCSTTIVTFFGPTSNRAPGGRAWTEAEVNALDSYTQFFADNAGGAAFYRNYEQYIDVDVRNQPTLAAPTVTNFSNNSRPTVSWVYSDTDGELQTAWQVKVFSSAVYSIPGFSPDVNTPVYDSAAHLGAQASWALTSDLQNGTTYKAYVKVGKNWNGPEGAYWYSAWGVSSAFTVVYVLVPPYTPAVTAAALTDDQQCRALVNVFSPVNQLTYDNSSFEGGIGGWTADVNMGAPTSSSTDAADGTKSLQMSSSASGDMQAKGAVDATFGMPRVSGGDTYTALCSFHAAVSARSCAIGIRWINSSGGTISTVFGSNITDSASAGVYTQASATLVAPGNAVQAIPVAKVIATGGAAEIHRIDKVSIHAGSSTVWTFGGLTADPTAFVLERGERVATARGPADNWAHPQVASAGTQLRSAASGFSWTTATDGCEWLWMNKAISAAGDTPGGLLHWTPRAAANNPLRLGTSNAVPETDWNFPVVVGQAHIFSFWAWVQSGTFTCTPKIEWLNDANGSVNSTSTGVQVTLTTTPQRVSISATCPAGVSAARGVVPNDGSSATADVYVTRIGWGLGTVPVDGKAAMGGPLVWSQVRFSQAAATSTLPLGYGNGEQADFADFDCPPARPVLYRATNGWIFNANNMGSAPSQYVTMLLPAPARTMLRSAVDPMLHVAVNRRRQASFARVEDAQVYHPLGRDGGPVKIRDWVGGEDGQLIVITSNEAQLARLDALVASGDILILQWAQGGRSYVMLTDRQYTEDMTDFTFCDADGTQPYMRFDTHTLSYIECQAS
jgi:hypothetical protein